MAIVDVVVVSYNSRRHLRACIEELVQVDDVRVIVIDNNSSDGSLESLADLSRVRTVALEQNDGFASGCNAGWQIGDAPYVLFLNPDARIEWESVLHLAKILAHNERVGAVAPKITESDGRLAFSQRRFPSLVSAYSRALFFNRIFSRARWSTDIVGNHVAYETDSSPDWVSGACVMVRRDALERLTGFDARFFMYCEDMDLCKRLREVGFEVRYDPDAVALHAGGASQPRSTLLPVLAQSRIRYAFKHEGRLRARLFCYAVALHALTHALVGRGGWEARRGHLRSLKLAVLQHRPRAGSLPDTSSSPVPTR
jgi:N-acetylglucosaminyl-diphospho-decaprenol L-rhamnosyltransferase